MKEWVIPTFEAAHPGFQGLFIFDQSSAHASLPPDTLKAFNMNKGNGGKQQRQRDTIIPMNNPAIEKRGMIQWMAMENGEAKGLEQTLWEHGFNTVGLHAKCSPVCPWENDSCCMACLLSKQGDFVNQISMLKTMIKEAGHECIFLPKFHCELNPIEMVLHFWYLCYDYWCYIVLGVGKISILTSCEENIWQCQDSCLGCTQYMSIRHNQTVLQLVLVIHECLSGWVDWKSSCMGGAGPKESLPLGDDAPWGSPS